MGIVTTAAIDQIKTGYHANFLDGMANANPQWDMYATRMQSSGDQDTYPILHALPQLREWLGPRQFNDLKFSSYTLPNRKFEGSVSLPVEAVEDFADNKTLKVDMISKAMRQLGRNVALWPEKLVTEAIIAGGATTCYDGQYFFDTDHPVDPYTAGSGTQANLFTSKPLTEANFATVLSSLQTLTDASGEVLNLFQEGNIALMVPAALRKTAKTIIGADNISQNNGATATASTQTNVDKGIARVIVNPRLDADSTTTWYVLDVSQEMKPFIFQERVAPMFQMVTDMQGEHVIINDEFLITVRARGAAGYGLWQMAAKCTQ